VAASDDYLIDLLVDMGFVTHDQVDAIRPKTDETGEGIVDTLVADKSLTRAQVAQAIDADAPIIKLVNGMIIRGVQAARLGYPSGAAGEAIPVRYRIDGMLHEMKSPPKRLQASIIARLKIMSNMSIAERRIPQDGRIQTNVGNKVIDLRVSCLPTNHGESIVMRILDKEGPAAGLGGIGLLHG
jgi:type IV pilus assembly protein PilB